MNRVDIVIPVYGRLDLLEQCLDSIPDACGSVPYKIYAVDDNSPDGIAEVKKLFSRYPHVSVKYHGQNAGFPKTVNDGARMGTGNLVFLLNSDVILDPGSVQNAVSEFENDPSVGVVGFKLRFRRDSAGDHAGKLQHVGLSFNITGKPHHIFIGWSADNKRANSLREVPAVTGAALMTTRTLWSKLKGMDLVYGRGTYEDVDYCFKVRFVEEKKVIVSMKASGEHYAGASAKDSGGFPLDLNHGIFYDRWRSQITWTDGELL